jgi:tetratricopeptide (TPR) repeat protein
MGKKGFWIATIGIIFGFIGGFFFANMLNRQEMDALKAKAAQAAQAAQERMELKPADGSDSDEPDLSPEEIKKKIQNADENPANAQYQRDLGLALYRYAGMKKDAALFPDAKRLLMRAAENDPRDFEVLVALGNVNFDIGQSKQDTASLEEARKYYSSALELKPKQVDLRTDLGSTYFLANPPQYDKALAEYRRSLQLDPDHVRTLDNLSRTLLMMGKTKEAEESITKLKGLDANYPGLSDLQSLLAQKKESK